MLSLLPGILAYTQPCVEPPGQLQYYGNVVLQPASHKMRPDSELRTANSVRAFHSDSVDWVRSAAYLSNVVSFPWTRTPWLRF